MKISVYQYACIISLQKLEKMCHIEIYNASEIKEFYYTYISSIMKIHQIVVNVVNGV